jgi:FAD/FMN-containing dehydrogenase
MAKRGEIAKILAMLALGGVAGAAIMALLAPRSGQETRAKIIRNSLKFVEKAKSAGPASQPALPLRRLSNWGNFPNLDVEFHEFEDIETLQKLVNQANNVIPRGNGRCYGDSALASQVISTLRFNKFLAFDAERGVIHCQAGILLSEVLDVVVPQGWFLPVTPGTKLITVGGAIASDVHGKSQHKAGNFSDHVLQIELMLGDGTIVTCSKTENPDLFWTTCSGMGLTGIILTAKLALIPVETAYIRQESLKGANLAEMMELFEQSEPWTYSVAWLDGLARGQHSGRGFIMRGEHAMVAELESPAQHQNPLLLKPAPTINVPFYLPGFILNQYSMRLFNTLLYLKHPAGKVETIEDYNKFFYPLDRITNWNRLYGRRGFTQYQFILPKAESRAGIIKVLQKINQSGIPPFLAVLKLYDRQKSYLPFAMKGYSLALDFPISPRLFSFLDELDRIVLDHGGRLYLTKDVRMTKQMFMQSYPNVDRFINNVKTLKQNNKFRSRQSDRIGLTS